MNARRAPAALWRGLDELEGSDEVARLVEAEFPAAAFAEGVDRRGLLRVMAASLLLAALPGCDDDSGDAAIPYVEQPEEEVPGVPRLYATAVTLAGIAQPVLGTTYSGRPTKLEGNPQHPASGGATDALHPGRGARSLRPRPLAGAVGRRQAGDLGGGGSGCSGAAPALGRQQRRRAAHPDRRDHLANPDPPVRRTSRRAARGAHPCV